MLRRTTKLTVGNHVEIGAELARIRAFLTDLYYTLPAAFGSRDPVNKVARRALNDIESLRSRLAAHFSKDWPGEADSTVYSPPHPLPAPAASPPSFILS